MSEILIPKNEYVTEAMLGTLTRSYRALRFEWDKDFVRLLADQLGDEERQKLALDLEFFSTNPLIPLENLCNHLDNYSPKNPSQEELLKYARVLVDLGDMSIPAGLFIHGEPGVGKTHVAVGLTKEFMKRGLKAGYVRADDYPRIRIVEQSLAPGQAWVIDDLNSPYGVGMALFKQIVLNAHDHGGRVFATSNTSYRYLMENAFAGDPDERLRYMDRTKGMFKGLFIEGGSRREETAWYRDVGFDPLRPETWKEGLSK